MKVTKSGNVYKATCVTGPTHNYLGLVLGIGVTAPLRVSRNDPKDGSPAQIEEDKLIAAVMDGVNIGNQSASVSLDVAMIEYVSSDTPRYDIYVELAASIIAEASKTCE